MTTTTQAAGRVPGAAVSPLDLFWLAPTVTSALSLLWFGLTGLVGDRARPEFSHGPVIPVLSFCMLLRGRKALPPAGRPVAVRRPGAAPMILALGRAIAPILPGEPKAEADVRARRFLPATVDRLHRFIPE